MPPEPVLPPVATEPPAALLPPAPVMPPLAGEIVPPWPLTPPEPTVPPLSTLPPVLTLPPSDAGVPPALAFPPLADLGVDRSDIQPMRAKSATLIEKDLFRLMNLSFVRAAIHRLGADLLLTCSGGDGPSSIGSADFSVARCPQHRWAMHRTDGPPAALNPLRGAVVGLAPGLAAPRQTGPAHLADTAPRISWEPRPTFHMPQRRCWPAGRRRSRSGDPFRRIRPPPPVPGSACLACQRCHWGSPP